MFVFLCSVNELINDMMMRYRIGAQTRVPANTQSSILGCIIGISDSICIGTTLNMVIQKDNYKNNTYMQ